MNSPLIKTFDPKLDDNKDLIEKLSIICKEISSGNDSLAKNYKPENFSLIDQIAITVIIDSDDNIIGFATLYDRKGFYNNCVRILNRWWLSPSIRKNKLWSKTWSSPVPITKSNQIATEIVSQQIDVAREKNINQLFISREGGAHRLLKYLVFLFEERTGLKWIAPKEMYKVCPANNLSCWQNILYTNIFKEEPINLETNGLTYERMCRNYKA